MKSSYYKEGQTVYLRGDRNPWVIKTIGPYTGEMRLHCDAKNADRMYNETQLQSLDVDFCGIIYETAEPATEYHESILLEAESLVHGDRNEDYGHPLDDFRCTAELWTTALHKAGILPKHKRLQYSEVAVMMMLLKISRELNKHKRDNLVDTAGYAETLQMCFDEEDRRTDQVLTFNTEGMEHPFGFGLDDDGVAGD